MILKNLSISKGPKTILKEISFELEKGLMLIYGKSGSGKSSLMVSIAGLHEFFGIKRSGEVHSDCSIQFEDTENQIIGHKVADELTLSEIDPKYLKLLGLEGYEEREIHTLSGGELKKLCIAEALSKEKRDLILDDPESHLDPESLEELLRILSDLSKERAILVLTRRPDLYDLSRIYKISGYRIKEVENKFKFKIPKMRSGKDVIIRGERIFFSYGDNTIFRNLNFEFKKGTNLVTGKNGSGKTTLLKILAGLLEYRGKIYYDSNKRISYVHQFPDRIFFHKFVWEEAKNALGEKYREILEIFCIDPSKEIKDLNRAKKALLAIACSFSADIVCLDEPSSSLDIESLEILLSAFQAVNKDYIIATNDRTLIKCLEEANFYKIERGKIYEGKD